MFIVKKKQKLIFQRVLSISAICILLLLISIFITLLLSSIPSIKVFGFSFIFNKTWDPVSQDFGALPFLIGTLLTSILALLLSTPFSLCISIFLGEYFKRGIIHSVLKNMIELLAGIPSIVYGFWGLFVLAPIVRSLEIQLGVSPYGVGLFTASFLPKSIFDPSNTMASVIANEFTEATGDVYLASLIEIGLLLFIVTMSINFLGRLVILS